jgi:hypothetical protein
MYLITIVGAGGKFKSIQAIYIDAADAIWEVRHSIEVVLAVRYTFWVRMEALICRLLYFVNTSWVGPLRQN